MGMLLSIFGNSVFGSLIGSVFSWLNKREETTELRAKNEHDEKMLTLQNAQAIALVGKQMEVAKVAGDVAVQAKEADAFVAAQAGIYAGGGTSVIDAVLRLVRPMITIYLLAIATYLAVNISRMVGGLGALDAATLLTLYGEIISEVFFLTNLAVSFWFGSRGSSSRLAITPKPRSTSTKTAV